MIQKSILTVPSSSFNYAARQQIAPGYSFAGMLLFDACLQDQEFSHARATLARLQEHIGGSGQPYVEARFVQLAAREGEEEDALNALRRVCTLHCDSTWPITTSVMELRNAGWSQQADDVLKESWDNEDGFHPWTLLVWLDGPEGTKARSSCLSCIGDRLAEDPFSPLSASAATGGAR